MKFQCSTEDLSAGVSLASRFVQRQANLPVLSSILIAAEGSAVVLRATNLECGVEITVPAKVTTGGIAAVPGSVFASFLGNVRGKTTSASLSGGVLVVETERAKTSLKTIPHDDFPTLPRVPAQTSFSAKASDFARALKSVTHCAASSAIKPELQSVYLVGEAGKLTAVATDSFRLAEKTISLRSKGGIAPMLIPAKNAAELVRILEGAAGDVEFYYNANQIATHIDHVYYTSRLLDGSFPNYKQIIPKSFAAEAVVLREDFSHALKSLAVFSDKFSQISFAVEPKNRAVMLSSRNADIGEEVYTLSATASGEGVALTFNGRYLADGLQSISGESVRLHITGAGKPMLIKDAADDSYLYLAMPMNR